MSLTVSLNYKPLTKNSDAIQNQNYNLNKSKPSFSSLQKQYKDMSFDEKVQLELQRRKQEAIKGIATKIIALALAAGLVKEVGVPFIQHQLDPTSSQAVPQLVVQVNNSSGLPQIDVNRTIMNQLTSPQALNPVLQDQTIDLTNKLNGRLSIQEVQTLCPQISDQRIQRVLVRLSEIKHNPDAVNFIRTLGIEPPLNSGMDSVNFIASNNIQFSVEPLNNSIITSYNPESNTVKINAEFFKENMNAADEMNLAAFIHHEIGAHALYRKTPGNSIDQELRGDSLTVLATLDQMKNYGEAFLAQGKVPVLWQGVQTYRDLFFEANPEKPALVATLAAHYGRFDMTSPSISSHPSVLAQRIKNYYETHK